MINLHCSFLSLLFRCVSIWLPLVASLNCKCTLPNMEGWWQEECWLSSIILFSVFPLCGYDPGEMCGLAYRALTWKPETLTYGQGHGGHFLIATICDTGDYLLFHFYILVWFTPVANVICFSLKMQLRYVKGLFCRYRAGHAGIVGYFMQVFFFLQKDFTPSVDLMPNTVFFFYIYKPWENIWFTFVMNSYDFHFTTSHSMPAWYMCVQTEDQEENVNKRSVKKRPSRLLWTFKKLWPWNYRDAAYNT